MVGIERVPEPEDEAQKERKLGAGQVEHRGTIGKQEAKIYTPEVTVTPAPISHVRLAPGPLELELGADPDTWIRSLAALPRPWFVFESPRGGCLVGSGEAARFAGHGPERFDEAARWLGAAAAAARREGARTSPVAVGAFGFGDRADAVAWVPSMLLVRDAEGVDRVESWQGSADQVSPTMASSPWTDGDRDAWNEAVEAALRRIEAGTLEKVVLARSAFSTGLSPTTRSPRFSRSASATPNAIDSSSGWRTGPRSWARARNGSYLCAVERSMPTRSRARPASTKRTRGPRRDASSKT
jgi:hypothetical protein